MPDATAELPAALPCFDGYRPHPLRVRGAHTPVAGAAHRRVQARAGTPAAGTYPSSDTGALNDVTSGANGSCGSCLCTAGTGYDGLSTPNGTAAFTG